jgi:PadR family transcriptional regulator, regulatory protein PadR
VNYISSEKQKLIQLSHVQSQKSIRMAVYLGEFEELVLLTVAALDDQAYGVSIQHDIETRCNRSISIGALHSTITRLEEKGFLKSWLGGATQERGGRSKRYFEITQAGKKAVTEAKVLRDELWSISKVKLSAAK